MADRRRRCLVLAFQRALDGAASRASPSSGAPAASSNAGSSSSTARLRAQGVQGGLRGHLGDGGAFGPLAAAQASSAASADPSAESSTTADSSNVPSRVAFAALGDRLQRLAALERHLLEALQGLVGRDADGLLDRHGVEAAHRERLVLGDRSSAEGSRACPRGPRRRAPARRRRRLEDVLLGAGLELLVLLEGVGVEWSW